MSTRLLHDKVQQYTVYVKKIIIHMQHTCVRDKWMYVQSEINHASKHRISYMYVYTSTLLKCSANISKIDNVPKNKTVKRLKRGLHIKIYQSAKVWATPRLQLILKSDRVSRFFKMVGQGVPQFTSKIWEGSWAESSWVSVEPLWKNRALNNMISWFQTQSIQG